MTRMKSTRTGLVETQGESNLSLNGDYRCNVTGARTAVHRMRTSHFVRSLIKNWSFRALRKKWATLINKVLGWEMQPQALRMRQSSMAWSSFYLNRTMNRPLWMRVGPTPDYLSTGSRVAEDVVMSVSSYNACLKQTRRRDATSASR